MTIPEQPPTPARTRRPPARFRHVALRRSVYLTPRMIRVTLAGPDLEGLTVEDPGASVRLLLPSPGSDELVIPSWSGNEFLLPDGQRPTLRTFTPPLTAAEASEIDLDVVLHDGGAASDWARSAVPGAPAAISGPGRGYDVAADAPAYLIGGDESAIPAISQLLVALDGVPDVQVHIEVGGPEGRLELPHHPGCTVTWHDLAPGAPPGSALVEAFGATSYVAGTRVWIAGEAASIQRIRRLLFEERGVPRTHASIRGYWKHGSRGDSDEA